MELAFKLITKRSMNTEQCFRARKAIEHLYYLTTVTGTPRYANDEAIWIGWVKMGFDTSLREGPRGVARTERIRVETQVEPRYVEIRAEASNTDALKVVGAILDRLEATKESFQGKDDTGRRGILLADPQLGEILLNPVVAALGRQKTLRPDESQRILQAAQDCLVWLTDNDITSLGVTAAVPV